MRHARALLPFAVTALVVVGASAAALSLAVADLRDAREAAVDRPSGVPSAVPRAFPELSRTGRLAYWRTDPGGGGELTVSNLDGTMRRTLARVDTVRRITLTRWTPDGEAIAYVDSGSTLAVVRLDGTRAELALPGDGSPQGGLRIVDHRWTADGSRVAASVIGTDLRSNIYVARPADGRWTRATTLDDAFVSDWLDGEHVLIHTGGGIIGSLRADATNSIRPLTGMTATSPIVADDGRIHFLRGSIVPASLPRELPYVTALGASVWSIGADGSDPKPETQNPIDDVRLDARYGAGRYLAHRGSSQLQVLLSEGVNIPSVDAGAVERAIVAPDGRSAVGFSANRIVRFDLVRGAALGTFGSPTVMLDSVAGGDVWHPRVRQPVAAQAPGPAQRPAARYAFSLGGHLWTMEPDGIASLLRLRALPPGRRAPPPPLWSPKRDRVLVTQFIGSGIAGGPTVVATSVDRDGGARPYAQSRAATATPTWSPDGEAFAVVVDRRGVDGTSAQAELEVRFLATLSGEPTRPAAPARDAAWTGAGVLLLTESTIELADVRKVVDLTGLLADPRGEFPADRTSSTWSSLAAPPDGAYVSVRIAVTPRTGANRFAIAVLRVADGEVMTFLPGSTVQDLTWAPARALLGVTIVATPESSAQVREASTGRVIAAQPGRFAGWSPEGDWYYVARPEGLFAHRMAGGDGVRVSAIGVPVSTTAP